MRVSSTRFAASLLAGAVMFAFLPGCGGPSGLEKPPENKDMKPDMNKMPGFNEMQDKMKKQGKVK